MPRPPSTGMTAPVTYAGAVGAQPGDGGGDLVGAGVPAERHLR